MKFEECVDTIVDFLRRDFNYNLNIKERDMTLSAFNMMMFHIDSIKNNAKVKEEYPIKLIIDTLEILRRKVIYQHIDNRFKNFIFAYLDITINWNENLDKNETVKTECDNIILLINEHYTMMDAIRVMKEVTNRLDNLKNWYPPSFELSRHYIEKLK